MSDWCLRELEFATSEGKNIISIWLEEIIISPRVKLSIQNTYYINYYSVSREVFLNSIKKSLNNEKCIRPEMVSEIYDIEHNDCWNEKYFLSFDMMKKIGDLLNAEQNGEHTICFIPENANLLGLAYELGIKIELDLKKLNSIIK